MITLKLPKTELLFSNRPYSSKAVNSLFSLVKNRSTPIGLVLTADYPDTSLILFILENRPYAAAEIQENGFKSLALRDFFGALGHVGNPALTLNAVNPVLFKCLLVAVQKAPTTAGTTDLVNVEALLERVKSLNQESVVAVRAKESLNLFYFSNGTLSEACFAEPPEETPDGTLEDQFLEYVDRASSSSPVQVETYEDLEVTPAEDHDLEWEESGEALVDYYLRPRPELVFLSGGSVAKKTIYKKELTLGRGPEQDVQVPDIKASREHVIIREVGGQFILEDQNSRNGTIVNNQKVSKVALVDGDEINIGNFRILFKLEAMKAISQEQSELIDQETTQIGMSDREPTSAVKDLSLRLTSGPQSGIIITLGDKLLIGRTKCDLNVNDTKVSRHHASIEKRKDGYLFTDLKSTNGSQINDQPIKSKILVRGDVIKVGETLLQVIEKESSS